MGLCRCYCDLPARRLARSPLDRRRVHLELVRLHGFNLGYRSLQSLRMNGLNWSTWGVFGAP